jgi:hypothetical protein
VLSGEFVLVFGAIAAQQGEDVAQRLEVRLATYAVSLQELIAENNIKLHDDLAKLGVLTPFTEHPQQP